jgi:hypothetical protein
MKVVVGLFAGLPSAGVYLGIGALCHALFVGSHFDWSSAWTYGWLFGWPAMIFAAAWALMLVLIVIGLGIAGVVFAAETISEWRGRSR